MKDTDLYELFDKCGLSAGNLLTSKQNMNQTVGTIRLRLAQGLSAYLHEQLAKGAEDE